MVSGTVPRRRLAAELRRLREAAGLTIKDVSEVLGCSTGKVGHMEQGRNRVSRAELFLLLDTYQASDEVRTVLEDLRRRASTRGWWATYGLPEWLQPYIGLETDASTMRNFELDVIPGLLQTELYARRVHLAARHLLPDPIDVDRRVNARLERQRRLSEAPLLELRAVVSEAAFRRVVGGTDVMRDQLDHVLKLTEQSNVKVQVLPYSVGEHCAMSGPMVLLEFPDPVDVPVAYLEYPLGGHLVDEPGAVNRLSVMFDDLRDAALSTRESKRFIAGIRGELT